MRWFKEDKKVVCGTGEGVLNIFNYDEWSNLSDRFPGHPSSVDSIVPVSDDILLTGCFDGNIRSIKAIFFFYFELTSK
jgi:WD repeat-containing protein 55